MRDLRAAGEGRLRVGRRVEAITARELADDEKLPVLREYLVRWCSEVEVFFEGLDVDATDEELAAVAAGFPAFEVRPAG